MEIFTMSTPQYGLEQARIKLPALVAQANAGVASVITRHGKPYAAIVSIEDLEKSAAAGAAAASVISLRGTGKDLWGSSPAQTVAELRDEWGDV
jgi:prevent-host-death family protein